MSMEPKQFDVLKETPSLYDKKFETMPAVDQRAHHQTRKSYFDSVQSPFSSDSPKPLSFATDSMNDARYYPYEMSDRRVNPVYDRYDHMPYRMSSNQVLYSDPYYSNRSIEHPLDQRSMYSNYTQRPYYYPYENPHYDYLPPEINQPSYRGPIDPRIRYNTPYRQQQFIESPDTFYRDETPFEGSPVESEASIPMMSSMENNEDDPVYAISIKRINSGEEIRTVVLVRNIPNRLRKKDVTHVLSNCVGPDNFCILRLPVDPFTKRNLGYAFVCFSAPSDVAVFFFNMNGQRWPSSNSQKRCTMCFAKKQNRVPASSFGHHDEDDDEESDTTNNNIF